MVQKCMPAIVALLMVVLPGCGGGEEPPRSAQGSTSTGTTSPPPSTEPAEEREGGAGDEEAASTAVALVGRDGRVRPARVEVPPYIALLVSLRAADARSYTLNVRGRTLGAGDALTLDGLPPDARHVLRSPSGGGRVVIVPSSEPTR